LFIGAQTLTPERGYSAARFVPGSGDRILLAVKSIELAATHFQTSFLSVITIDGEELLPETELPGNIK
jgi:soluble calcium-activated nucleotidase 1